MSNETKYRLVLIRHGESTWNKANKFTGWTDVDLTENGVKEAAEAGQLLAKEAFEFDQVFTSYLKRAIRTMWICLENLDQVWLPVERAWQLNERHYGALQGLNKKETAEKYGDEQVFTWRRSFKTPPPALETSDERHPQNDRRYKKLSKAEIPATEALYHCLQRVLPYWEKSIVPEIQSGKRVLIVAHGNSLRALVKHLDGISDDEIAKLNIPTGVPLVYELNQDLKPIKSYYLGDKKAAAEKAAAVANQAKN